MFGLSQRSRLSIGQTLFQANVRAAQYRETFGIRGHYPIFNSVVHHYDEVPGSVTATTKVALIRRGADRFSSGRSRCTRAAGSEPCKDRVEMRDDLRLTSDHHAISPLKTPHTTARSNVHIMNAPVRQIFCATYVIDVIGVAAVNQNIARV